MGESIYDQKTPNLKTIDTKVVLTDFDSISVLNSILKFYSILTSGKGSFPRLCPRWLPGSYNSFITITIQFRTVLFYDLGLNNATKSLKLLKAN